MIDKLFFIGYQSLGDTFIFNGIAHHYAKLCKELHIPTAPWYADATKCLYQDFPNIKVVSLLPEQEDQYVYDNRMSRIVRKRLDFVGNIDNKHVSICFDMQYYDMYELPFSYRYKNFKLPREVDGADELYNRLVQNNEPYVLYHTRTSGFPNGMPIDVPFFRTFHQFPNIKVIEVDRDLDQGNILKWVKLIRNATEIHVVNGAFWNLTESMLEQTKAQLYFHDIRHPVVRINHEWNNHRWNIVKYDRIVEPGMLHPYDR